MSITVPCREFTHRFYALVALPRIRISCTCTTQSERILISKVNYGQFLRCLSVKVDNGDDDAKTVPNLSVSLFKNPIVHQLWSARQEAKKKSLQKKSVRRAEDNSNGVAISTVPISTSAAEDKERRGKLPSESRVEVNYPFATDALLWESYRNPWGSMRFGKMLEDLDALAGNIAFLHVDSDDEVHGDEEEQMHPVIVTASVDKITLRERPKHGSNQRLGGQVTWTGKSSMEIRMKCIEEGAEHEWVDAYFTFVTLDPITKKPVQIPPVIPSTVDEQADFDSGAARAEAKKVRRRQEQQQQQVTVSPDSDEIHGIAQKLLAEANPLLTMPSLADPYSILLLNTRMQNAEIAQPQAQNLHNRIFGGFLMRRAFELAFSNAYLFCGSRPIFLEVDEISFTSPVDVGDLVVFNSCVLYTEAEGNLSGYYIDKNDVTLPLLHIEVEAWVTEPEKASAKLSNRFSFTFAVSRSEKSPSLRIRKVLPSNIDEAYRMAKRMHADKLQRTCINVRP